jgi:hypothetical protein
MSILIAQSFGKAFCKHFGLPADQVAQEIIIHNKPNDVFGATVQIYLTGDDLESIGKIMKDVK